MLQKPENYDAIEVQEFDFGGLLDRIEKYYV